MSDRTFRIGEIEVQFKNLQGVRDVESDSQGLPPSLRGSEDRVLELRWLHASKHGVASKHSQSVAFATGAERDACMAAMQTSLRYGSGKVGLPRRIPGGLAVPKYALAR